MPSAKECWLMNVFLGGRLELSNNRAEHAVRPFTLGRKNWPFPNALKSDDAGIAVYSIVETTLLILIDVLQRCAALLLCTSVILYNKCVSFRYLMLTCISGCVIV